MLNLSSDLYFPVCNGDVQLDKSELVWDKTELMLDKTARAVVRVDPRTCPVLLLAVGSPPCFVPGQNLGTH